MLRTRNVPDGSIRNLLLFFVIYSGSSFFDHLIEGLGAPFGLNDLITLYSTIFKFENIDYRAQKFVIVVRRNTLDQMTKTFPKMV